MTGDGIDKSLYESPNPLPLDDPAYWMLQRGLDETEGRVENTGWVTPTNTDIYRNTCYICIDPEFALMGLPVCYACLVCGGHVPADDVECENGHTDPRYGEFDPDG